MTESLAARMDRLVNPVLHATDTGFTVAHRETRKGKEFVILSCPVLHSTQKACEWLAASFGGSWLTPTIMLAGEAWTLNPRLSEYGQWEHLLFRIV